VLDFMQPQVAGGQLVGRCGKAWRDESGREVTRAGHVRLNRLRGRRRKALLVLGKAATDCAIIGPHHPSAGGIR
jgi:hypothetical protein